MLSLLSAIGNSTVSKVRMDLPGPTQLTAPLSISARAQAVLLRENCSCARAHWTSSILTVSCTSSINSSSNSSAIAAAEKDPLVASVHGHQRSALTQCITQQPHSSAPHELSDTYAISLFPPSSCAFSTSAAAACIQLACSIWPALQHTRVGRQHMLQAGQHAGPYSAAC